MFHNRNQSLIFNMQIIYIKYVFIYLRITRKLAIKLKQNFVYINKYSNEINKYQ